jgi:hypothetical protein
LELEFLLEKHLPSNNLDNKLTRDAIKASKLAMKKKSKEAHYAAAKAHLHAYNLHKQEHIKQQKAKETDIYAYNRTANLAKAHYAKFQEHKKYTDWKT